MRLHPLGGLLEKVHLLQLLLVLLLHNSEDLLALLPLFYALLVLVLDQGQLVVDLVEFLGHRLLLASAVAHVHIVSVEVLRIETVRLLVFFAQFGLICLIPQLKLGLIEFKLVDLLLQCGHLIVVLILESLKLGIARLAYLSDLFVHAALLIDLGLHQGGKFSLALLFLFFRFFLELLQLFLFKIAGIAELLHAHLKDAELLFD